MHKFEQSLPASLHGSTYKPAMRAPLPSVSSVLVTLLGLVGGALVLVYIGVTH